MKLKAISFSLIVMVLYIHGYYLEAETYSVASYVQDTIDKGLCSVAVPMFFCISGFLFFNGVNSVSKVFEKQKRRMRTLMVPYVLWNIIFILWYVVMAMIPSVASFVNSDMIGKLSASTPWNALCLLFVEPAGFHLWFLRDLIVFVAFTPLVYLLLKCIRWLLPFLLALLSLKVYFFNGMFFFALGGCISMHNSLGSVDRCADTCFLPAIVGWLLFALVLPLNLMVGRLLLPAQLCGIVALWKLFDVFLKKRQIRWLNDWHVVDYTFFIYVFHEPFFNIVKKLTLCMLGKSDISLIALYLLNPIIAIVFILCVAMLIQELLPRTYSILTGGRI